MGKRRRAWSVHFPGHTDVVWVLGCEKVASPTTPPLLHLQGSLVRSQCLLAGQVQPLASLCLHPQLYRSAPVLLVTGTKAKEEKGRGSQDGGAVRPLGEWLTPQGGHQP